LSKEGDSSEISFVQISQNFVDYLGKAETSFILLIMIYQEKKAIVPFRFQVIVWDILNVQMAMYTFISMLFRQKLLK